MTLYDETKPVHHILAEAGLRPYATYPLRTGACERDQPRWPYQWRFHEVNVAEREARLIAANILSEALFGSDSVPSLVKMIELAAKASVPLTGDLKK